MAKAVNPLALVLHAGTADAKNQALGLGRSEHTRLSKEGSFYGATKKGKFMTEDEAVKAGFFCIPHCSHSVQLNTSVSWRRTRAASPGSRPHPIS
jgi:hypothetical protein